MTISAITSYREQRLSKVETLRRLGINPYPSESARTHRNRELIEEFDRFKGHNVTVTGRLISWRPHGKITFGHLHDQSGSIQCWLRRGDLQENIGDATGLDYDSLDLVDLGDFVEVNGILTKTGRGEISVLGKRFRILGKALRPLPDKWHGLKNRETLLRRRYLATAIDPNQRRRFELISKMVYSIRGFLDSEGFLEFQTPILQPQYGGGTARPFTTYVNALGREMFLAISHELYLKRLIAAGFEKVYTIGRYFRNEGIDRYHQPEFSMVETMTAYESYLYGMDLVERLFQHVTQETFGKTRFQVGKHEVDFGRTWRRVAMADAVQQVTGLDFRLSQTPAEARRLVQSLGIEPSPTEGAGECMARVFTERVEPTLIEPTFVHSHPVEISPLAKARGDDPRFAERFEIFLGGIECGDNWSEENDPLRLLEHWERLSSSHPDGEQHPIDYDFLEVLEFGIPPTTGIGPGIERMAMILTEQDNIDDVVFFPLMKPQLSKENRMIFGVASPSPTLANEEEVVVAFDELDNLMKDRLLRPASNRVLIRPFLEIWPHSVGTGPFRASGYLIINGLLANRLLRVPGYMVATDDQPTFDEEARKFLDLIALGLEAGMRRRFPGIEIEISSVEASSEFSLLIGNAY